MGPHVTTTKRPPSPEDAATERKQNKVSAMQQQEQPAVAPSTSPTDCILQVVSEDQLDKLCAYFDDAGIQRILFPPSHPCALSVENVTGPLRRTETGKSFLQFNGISAPAGEWVKWMNESPVRFAITRMYFLDGGEQGVRQTAESLDELVEQLAAHGAKHPPPGPIRLQFRPRTMEKVLLDRLEAMDQKDNPFEFHPVKSVASLHVFQYPGGTFRWSMRTAEEQFYTSPDGPTRIPGSFTRAAAKLAEALLVSGETIDGGGGRGDGGGGGDGDGGGGGDTDGGKAGRMDRVAVDVGASPGGWTHHLAVGEGMDTVIAIDPAELHDTVLALDNVKHLKMTSQVAGDEIERILGPERKISVLTCDANRHPKFVAEMLSPVVKYLKEGGLMVITMKFQVRKRKMHAGDSAAAVEKQLKDGFAERGLNLTGMRSVWLLSNTAFERTILARVAGGPGEGR